MLATLLGIGDTAVNKTIAALVELAFSEDILTSNSEQRENVKDCQIQNLIRER